jgi:hypothetical protein
VSQFMVLSALKNEGPYIIEHYLWHRSLGFTKFFYYYNDCTDGSAAALRLLCDRDPNVQMIVNARTEHRSAQTNAYKHFRKNFMTKYHGDYLLVIDLDEFLFLHEDSRIEELVSRLICPDAISFFWRNFGSAGEQHFEPKMVTQRFTRCAPTTHQSCSQFKSMFLLSKNIIRFDVHRPEFGGSDPRWVIAGESNCQAPITMPISLRVDVLSQENYRSLGMTRRTAEMLHYSVKSREEFEWRARRGRGLTKGGSNLSIERHTSDYFSRSDTNDESFLGAADRSALLLKEFEELNSLFRVSFVR